MSNEIEKLFDNPNIFDIARQLQHKNIEEAYKKGFSHGFHVGIRTKTEDFEEMIEKVNEWRCDDSIIQGAPGTPLEGHIFGFNFKEKE